MNPTLLRTLRHHQAGPKCLLLATATAAGCTGDGGRSDHTTLLLDPTNAEWTRPSPPVWHARFETNKGDFVLELVRDQAPIGNDRFYNLVRLGYCDGRVIEGMEVLDRLYAGYGEQSGSGVRQGRQGPIVEGGNEYLDRNFPLLDRIIRATLADFA